MGLIMADEFRRLLDVKTGVGGVHCDCCNDFKGKQRQQLKRIIRAILKRQLKKETSHETM